MLIINADDYGKTRGATDRILLCYMNRRISSATAMMFMADSERSAELAVETGIDIGLHLNLSDHFTGNHHPSKLDAHHERVSRFLNRNRLSLIFYNPRLRNDFEYTFKSQWERFLELYKRPPSHVDGHRHKHLCSNALLGNIIPAGVKVRRNFHFGTGEKGVVNRLYRAATDWYLMQRYICTDYFFSIHPFENVGRIRGIAELAADFSVEMMVHPEIDAELAFLMGNEYPKLLDRVDVGSYSRLPLRTRYALQG